MVPPGIQQDENMLTCEKLSMILRCGNDRYFQLQNDIYFFLFDDTVSIDTRYFFRNASHRKNIDNLAIEYCTFIVIDNVSIRDR